MIPANIVKCHCGGKYMFNLESFDDHTKKDQHHLNWIYKINIDCQCGGSYNYSNQNNHQPKL